MESLTNARAVVVGMTLPNILRSYGAGGMFSFAKIALAVAR